MSFTVCQLIEEKNEKSHGSLFSVPLCFGRHCLTMPKRRMPPRPTLKATRGRAIQSQGGVELNNYDRFVTHTNDVTRTQYHYGYSLTAAITTGSGVGERVGRKITIKEIEYRGFLWLEAGITRVHEWHFAIVQDKQANGFVAGLPGAGAASGAGAYSVIWQNAAPGESMHGVRNLATAERFRVLVDRRGTLQKLASGVATTSNEIVYVHGRKRVNIPVMYSPEGAVQTNEVFVAEGFGPNLKDGTLPASAGQFHLQVRVRYQDS